MSLPSFSRSWLIVMAAGVALTTPSLVLAAGKVKIESPTETKVETISAYNPHRVVVYDQDFPYLVATSARFINGDTGKIEGTIGAGYQSNLAFNPANRDRFYVADTFHSRLTYGKRVDVLTTYDTATLSPIGEVELPAGRYLVVQKKYNAGVTPDGRYALSFNETPAMSVSVVDLENNAYVGEIQARGCWGIFPTANDRYVGICGDGGLITVAFKPKDGGGLDSEAKQTKPFFEPQDGTVFEAPGFGRRDHKLMFVSYHGQVHPVDVSEADPKFEEQWSILAEADKGWLPGGWQPLAYSSQTKRLYVLMHEGGQWTHKFPGSEVWVFDSKTHKRVQRVKLNEKAVAISISPDDEQLYTLADEGVLDIYEAQSGKLLHTVKGVGVSPATLYSAKDM